MSGDGTQPGEAACRLRRPGIGLRQQLRGHGRGIDQGAVRHHHQPHHHTLKLAHVARPGMRLHQPDGRLAELHRVAAPGKAGFVRIVANQDRHILRPIAQRGQTQRQHRQPVIQVQPKLAAAHPLGQVAVGGGHDPHIQTQLAAAADPHHDPLLQHPQQLGLHDQRQFADFVQKQGAALGLLEAAGQRARRPGESATFMAEELGLEQTLGHRRAIDVHEGRAGPPAGLMDGPREKFLAGAGLAQQQHRHVGGRQPTGLLQAFPQLRRVAQDAEVGQLAAQPNPQVAIFTFELRGAPLELLIEADHLGEHRADGLHQLEIVVERPPPVAQPVRSQHADHPLPLAQRHRQERDGLVGQAVPFDRAAQKLGFTIDVLDDARRAAAMHLPAHAFAPREAATRHFVGGQAIRMADAELLLAFIPHQHAAAVQADPFGQQPQGLADHEVGLDAATEQPGHFADQQDFLFVPGDGFAGRGNRGHALLLSNDADSRQTQDRCRACGAVIRSP
jgi:hypothetical protein